MGTVFKVGDRVRVVKMDDPDWQQLIGMVGIIESIDQSMVTTLLGEHDEYWVVGSRLSFWLLSDELELVTDDQEN